MLLGVRTVAQALDQEASYGLSFRIVGRDGQLLPCRIHVHDAERRPQRAADMPFWHDHFVCPGVAELQVAPGRYRYDVERGPEWDRLSGTVTVPADGSGSRIVRVEHQLTRIADLLGQGWYAGDLHVHRPVDEVELLMRAEDLHVVPVITWWNERNAWAGREIPEHVLKSFDGHRYYHIMAGEDEREGGALLYFHLPRPVDITKSTREFPSPLEFVDEARRQDGNVWVDIEKPFWWDVPVWLAVGQVASIGIANNHMCRRQMFASEAWGRPRDRQRLPDPLGNGFWSQEIYYHALNCGLRIPPSAGSASGVLPNPVGYNRIYVRVPENFSYQQWWSGLRRGESFVTNGPLVLCRANGEWPGHVFRADGAPLVLDLDISLHTLDRVPQLELIKDGRVERAVVTLDQREQRLRAEVTFERSGWFLIRAIADNEETFRFASTAPYYVEFPHAPRRISRASAQFFLDWVRERRDRVADNLADPDQRSRVLLWHEKAERFWQARFEEANAD
jgi:hypothetical protein